MVQIIVGILVGVLVGVFSGLIGVGGGIILIPILVFGFGMSQKLAQGTSLTMLLPPTGLLAFWTYYKSGNADLKLGLIMSLGVFIGGYFGGQWAQTLPQATLRKLCAVVLAGVAVRMFLQK